MIITKKETMEKVLETMVERYSNGAMINYNIKGTEVDGLYISDSDNRLTELHENLEKIYTKDHVNLQFNVYLSYFLSKSDIREIRVRRDRNSSGYNIVLEIELKGFADIIKIEYSR